MGVGVITGWIVGLVDGQLLGADRSEVAAGDEEKRVRFRFRKVPAVSFLGRGLGGG
jgi:hypothetical protein